MDCGHYSAAPGRVRCEECLAKRANMQRIAYSRPEIRDREIGRQKLRIKKLLESGLCVKCGKPREDLSKQKCLRCLVSDRIYQRRYKQRKRLESDNITFQDKKIRAENGFCYICGKPKEPGYRTCPECHRRLAENVSKARNNATWQEDVELFWQTKKNGGVNYGRT